MIWNIGAFKLNAQNEYDKIREQIAIHLHVTLRDTFGGKYIFF